MPPLFPTTEWPTVHKAWLSTPEGRAALGEVCERYRDPVVIYLGSVVRTLGLDDSIAEEVAHDWFVHMLESRDMFEPGRIKGSFGAYVRHAALMQLRMYLRKQSRQKRGGGLVIESLDSHPRFADTVGEDELFDTICARHHLELAEAMVRALWTERGKQHLWAALNPILAGESTLERALQQLGLKSRVTLRGHYKRLRDEMNEALKALDRAKPGDPELDRWLQVLTKAPE